MTINDAVTYLARPNWGLGLIEDITPNGWLVISFEIDGEYFRGEFSPHEVDLAPTKTTA